MANTVYEVTHKPTKAWVEFLEKGRVINGKYVPPGNLRVVKGANDEEYWIPYDTFLLSYEDIPDELMARIKQFHKI